MSMNELSGIKEVKTIRKQATNPKILIPLLIILSLLIGMGAVSAADINTVSQANSVSSQKLAPIEISGLVKKCSDGTAFEGAKVTVKNNGKLIASTTTKADGTYNLRFQSKSRTFTVTASANGHKPSTKTVSVKKNAQGTYTGKADFKLGANDAYVYKGWTSDPSHSVTFSDGTIIDGTATNARTSIAAGITYATSNPGVNTVYIAPDTYNEHDITISNSVNLHGENQATTIIDAQNAGQIFYINSGVTANIQQLTLTHGSSGYGGAIMNYGTLNINDCTFSGNSVSASGGVIYNEGPLTISRSTFSGNSAMWGGALWNNNLLRVTGSTFTGNTAEYGGAIRNWGTTNANFNRFYNNDATTEGDAINCISGSVNAENNWWGSNIDPATVTNLITGIVDANPWVIFSVNGNKATINNGETSTITADFNHVNGGGDLVGGHIPDGTPVTFATTLGSIPGTVVNTVGGIATATFTASQTAGTAYISGLIDDYQTPYDPNNPNTTPYTTVTINPVTNAVISKTINNPKAKYNVGNVVTYTIKVTNNGPDTATGATITDDVSGIGDDPVEYFQFVSATGPYTFDDVTKTVTWTLSDLAPGESVTYTLKVKILDKAAGETVRNKADLWLTEYPGHVYDVVELYTAKANLYVKVTSSKKNPEVGEKFILTYKLGNKGPDAAENVTITIPLPAGFELVSISGDGTWTYDKATRTITWTMKNVPVGDPYLYIIGFVNHAGSYVFSASIASDTYIINTEGTPITINAVNAPSEETEVKAASHTVGMQKTGVPIAAIILAVLMLFGGLLFAKKEQ